MSSMGDRIKGLRLEKGWTQEELGERLGLGKAAVNKYESEIVVNIKRDTIAKLAQLFNVSPSYILGLDENKKPASWESELSDEDFDLLNRIKRLSPEQRRLVEVQIQAWLKAD